MSARQLLIGLILIYFGPISGSLFGQDLHFKTIGLTNGRFIVSNEWPSIEIDPDGEDSNSQKYGLTFPPQQEGSDIQIKQTTISREWIGIKIEIINNTADTWKVEEISVDVLEKYELSSFTYNEGVWSGSDIRSMSYIPNFELTNDLLNKPPEIYIRPSRSFVDNRFWIKVASYSGKLSTEGIFAFQFKCQLTSRKGDRIEAIKSDKIYLLASG